MTAAPRILLAEDHAMVGDGIRAMLHPDFDVVEIVREGTQVLPAIAVQKPDFLLLDLSLPGRLGIDVLMDVRKQYPQLPVVIVSMHTDMIVVNRALDLGALGFVPKDSGQEELRTGIALAMIGRRYVSPRVRRKATRAGPADPMGFAQLTGRQQEIVRLVSEGLSSEDIASRIGISIHTVSFHRKNIARRLGLKGDVELMRYALLVSMAEANRRLR